MSKVTLAPPASASKLDSAARPSTLLLRSVLIDSYHENVAYLHRDCAAYRAEGFKALSKVEIRARAGPRGGVFPDRGDGRQWSNL